MATRATLPKGYNKSDGALVTDFTTVAVTSYSGTQTTAEMDTTHYITGSGAFHLVNDEVAGDSSAGCLIRFDDAHDWSDVDYFSVWLYDNTGTDLNTPELSDMQLVMYAYNTAFQGRTNGYASYGVLSAAVYRQGVSEEYIGWKCFRFKKSDFADVGTPTGWDSIAWWALDIQTRGSGAAASDIWIDSVYTNQYSRPKLVISFDDNHATFYGTGTAGVSPTSGSDTGAFDYMYTQQEAIKAGRGLPGVLFINSDKVPAATGLAGDFCTVAQLNTMHTAGWDIANHMEAHENIGTVPNDSITESSGTYTVTDATAVYSYQVGQTVAITGAVPAGLNGTKTITAIGATTWVFEDTPGIGNSSTHGYSTLTPASVSTSYQACRDYINANVSTRASDIFAYPFTQYEDTNVATIKALGCKIARGSGKSTLDTTDYGVTTHNMNHPVDRSIRGQDPMYLPALFTLSTDNYDAGAGSGANLKGAIDRLIRLGGLGIIYGHEIVAAGASTSSGQTDIDDFKVIIDYIIEKRDAGLLDVVSLSEYLEGIDNQRPLVDRAAT